VLDVRGVRKRYGDVVAVDDISFEVKAGEIFGLLGPNGAGKTSLIRMIVDILRPDAGSIRVFGQTMAASLQGRIGYLPEERGLYQHHTVGEVLLFLAELKGLTRADAKARGRAFLERVELGHAVDKQMRDLSKGMQQKLLLAAVMQHDPELLIVDEPFIGLDPINRQLVIGLLREAVARGAAVILSTHLMDHVEALCERAIVLHRGKTLLAGTVREIRQTFPETGVLLETDKELDGFPGVATRQGNVVTLLPGTRPEDFLAQVLATGAEVTRFERLIPTLDEVFVRAVRGA
jgi:ABC-2 type transport system ATP-binding protein